MKHSRYPVQLPCWAQLPCLWPQQPITHSSPSQLARALISVLWQVLWLHFRHVSPPQACLAHPWMVWEAAERCPSSLGRSSDIWQLQDCLLQQSCSCRARWCHTLSCCHKLKGHFWKIGLCGDGWWWRLWTAKSPSPLSDLAVRNVTGSWTMIWALKTNTKPMPGPFFKTSWSIMYQSNWKLSWGKTFCFFAKQIHCSLTGKSSQEHFSVRDRCLNLSLFMNVLSRWKMSPRNQLQKFRNVGIG